MQYKTRRAVDPLINHLLQSPPRHLRPFVQAVQNEDYRAIDRMLEEGSLRFDETISECHGAPLMLALDKGSDRMVEYLLSKGANPFFVSPLDVEDNDGALIARTAWYAYFQMNDLHSRHVLRNKLLEKRPQNEREIQQSALACIVCEQDFFTFKQVLEWGAKPLESFSSNSLSLLGYTQQIAEWKPDRFRHFHMQLLSWQKKLDDENKPKLGQIVETMPEKRALKFGP